MANYSTTELAAWIPTLVAQKSLDKLVGNLVFARKVNRDWSNEFKEFGNTVSVRKPTTITIQSKTANTDITFQNTTAAKVDVTLNKYKIAALSGEDVAIMESMTGTWEKLLGDAMLDLAVQVEKDIVAECANLTGTSVGTQGTAMTDASIRSARKILKTAKVDPKEQLQFVAGNNSAAEILGFTNVAAAMNRGQAETIRTGDIGQYMGFDFSESQYVDTTGTPSGDKNVAFAPSAITLAVRPLRPFDNALGVQSTTEVNEDTGLAVRLTKQVDQKSQAVTAVFAILYGAKAIRPELGCYVFSD